MKLLRFADLSLTGFCETVQKIYITQNFKRTIICAYLLIYLQSHHHHPIQAYSLENYKVIVVPHDLFLFKVDLVNSPTVLAQFRVEPFLWIRQQLF